VPIFSQTFVVMEWFHSGLSDISLRDINDKTNLFSNIKVLKLIRPYIRFISNNY
jgi:hypothetical protein